MCKQVEKVVISQE